MSDTPTLPPIEQLVPHQGDMCLLDEVCSIGEEQLVAAIRPHRNDLFADDLGIPAWVGLEWMAQAIAAWSGHTMLNAGHKPHVGFLLGTRRYDSKVSHFSFALRYQVKIELDYMADNGLGAFRGEIFDAADRVVASASLNVFQPDSDDMLDAMFNDDRPKDSQ
ncbi:hotdog family protein [Halomonas huangheensis]|uniref:3-hydroxylacyl-ACP dehydratase n=1 Tax=Halomonas huangheensis TaxID=1178482 RepID=W1N2E8_9GAMM|nr:hotdog family protein [Halomonas huangheensis]ALM51241.1 hypothetical protein AR456_02230 [Halomonas huangheensis]ERL49664.1 hypothetical protein BJB45_00670 [Halomonas huangheensis]